MTLRSLFCAAAALVVVSAASGGQPRTGPDIWNRRAPGTEYQPVLEVSGREELGLFLERAREPQNLRAICQGRREAIDIAIPTQQRYLQSLLDTSAAARDFAEIAWAHRSLGQLWAYVGRLDRAAAEFESAYGMALERHGTNPQLREALAPLEAMIGVAHLRRGELENCIENHHAASCIFPIREQGRHQRTSGSERALGYFLKHLARQPDNLEVQWLLNVAAMTLGRHPEAVPERWRLPAKAYTSDEDPGRFEDIAGEVGLHEIGRAGGAVIEDYDADGRFDIFVSSTDVCASARLYRNAGGGRFEDRTASAGISEQLGGINATHTDYNNDGRMDLFVMRGGWEYPMRNSLLRNDGNGTFTDVTSAAGARTTALTPPRGPTSTATAGSMSSSRTRKHGPRSSATTGTARSATSPSAPASAGPPFRKAPSGEITTTTATPIFTFPTTVRRISSTSTRATARSPSVPRSSGSIDRS